MFRKRQDLEPLGSGQIFLERVKLYPEKGCAERVLEPQCSLLPPVKSTELKTLIKAGVPLEQVNPKILSASGTVGLGVEKSQNEGE